MEEETIVTGTEPVETGEVTGTEEVVEEETV
jgi:hypothetical protein